MNSLYVVYMLECADGTYYIGVTRDLNRRLSEHNEGKKGAKYTKVRRPVRVVYSELAIDRSAALKREYALRQLTRVQKSALVQKYSLKLVGDH
ncbi:MAG: endonuclease [Parcubacteria group bacterium CG2_30_44_11]|nr:MAG: endonuclease [Parcubacteria group bacterium CG2_30_44_11]